MPNPRQQPSLPQYPLVAGLLGKALNEAIDRFALIRTAGPTVEKLDTAHLTPVEAKAERSYDISLVTALSTAVGIIHSLPQLDPKMLATVAIQSIISPRVRGACTIFFQTHAADADPEALALLNIKNDTERKGAGPAISSRELTLDDCSNIGTMMPIHFGSKGILFGEEHATGNFDELGIPLHATHQLYYYASVLRWPGADGVKRPLGYLFLCRDRVAFSDQDRKFLNGCSILFAAQLELCRAHGSNGGSDSGQLSTV